jgi:hypothetical protein
MSTCPRSDLTKVDAARSFVMKAKTDLDEAVNKRSSENAFLQPYLNEYKNAFDSYLRKSDNISQKKLLQAEREVESAKSGVRSASELIKDDENVEQAVNYVKQLIKEAISDAEEYLKTLVLSGCEDQDLMEQTKSSLEALKSCQQGSLPICKSMLESAENLRDEIEALVSKLEEKKNIPLNSSLANLMRPTPFQSNLKNHLDFITKHSRALEQACIASDVTGPMFRTAFVQSLLPHFSDMAQPNQNPEASFKQIAACYFRDLIKRHQDSSYSYEASGISGKVYTVFESQSPRLLDEFPDKKLISDGSVYGIVWKIGLTDGISTGNAILKYRKPADVNDLILHEAVIGMILNKLREQTPAFMYLYSGFSCNSAQSNYMSGGSVAYRGNESDYNISATCSLNTSTNMDTLMLSECIEGRPLSELLGYYSFLNKVGGKDSTYFVESSGKKISSSQVIFDLVLNCLMQVICALALAQSKFRYVHGDLHAGNVMVTRLPSVTTLEYNIGTKNIKIKTLYLAQIIDYGLSRAEYDSENILPYNPSITSITSPEHFQYTGTFLPLFDLYRLYGIVVHTIATSAGAKGTREQNFYSRYSYTYNYYSTLVVKGDANLILSTLGTSSLGGSGFESIVIDYYTLFSGSAGIL